MNAVAPMFLSTSFWWLKSIIGHKLVCVIKWDLDPLEMIVC